jgi:release factor glutamine methyltransferase
VAARATPRMTTVLEIIEGGTRYLEKRGVADARRNMQLLVASQLGCSRMDLYTQFDRPLEEPLLSPLREMLRKRGEGVPLQHLVGTVSFYHHEFKTDARALIPRPETEELVELILAADLPEKLHALDIGCGSGVIGICLAAARPAWKVTLADISEDALTLAAENAQQIGVQQIECVQSDLFASLPGAFDLVAANLPYIPESEQPTLSREVLHDPATALFGGADGLDILRRFARESADHIAPGGWVFLEVGHDQASQVADFLESSGFHSIETKRDLSGAERFCTARR